MPASREDGPDDIEMPNPQGSPLGSPRKVKASLSNSSSHSNSSEVKHVSLASTHNMQAIMACTLYSFCSVSMILVNKSLASR
jgi:hypothetical protein